jgi:hypothetical protein
LETPKAMEIFMVITIIKNRLTTILVVIYWIFNVDETVSLCGSETV